LKLQNIQKKNLKNFFRAVVPIVRL
jgi:hypothetical protein